jgi:hypothetical protein
VTEPSWHDPEEPGAQAQQDAVLVLTDKVNDPQGCPLRDGT